MTHRLRWRAVARALGITGSEVRLIARRNRTLNALLSFNGATLWSLEQLRDWEAERKEFGQDIPVREEP